MTTLDELGGWPALLIQLLDRQDLPADSARAAMTNILDGHATPAQLIAFVVALRAKGETAEEISGLLDAVLAAATFVPLSDDLRDRAIDIVGTGGDRSHSINVSTISAFVVAGAGVPVCKHGARAASSKCGAADVLEALGVAIELPPEGVLACVERAGIGFCLAPRYHPAFRFAAPARREIGIATVFNLLGPMANPARVRRQLIGVANPAFAERMLASLRIHGSLSAWVVHGSGLVVKLVFILALLRMSSASVIGNYGLMAAIDLVVIYVAGLEFHTFTARRYALRPTATRLRMCVACHLWLLRGAAPLAAILAVIVAWALNVQLGGPGLLALAVIAGSGAIAQEVMRLMILSGQPVHSVTLGFLRTTGWQPFALPILSPHDNTVVHIAFLWATASVLATAWGVWTVRAKLTWRTKPRARYIQAGITTSWRYYLTGSASVLQGNVEKFILQLALGPTAVGVFAFYQTMANTLPALLQSAILNISLPRLLSEFGQRRCTRMPFLHQLRYRSLIGGVLIGSMILFATWPLLQFASRGLYDAYFWILPLLLVAQLLMMWTQPIHLALYASHHDHELMWLTIGALSASLAITSSLVAAAGLGGAAVSPLVVGVAVATARHVLMQRLHAARSM